MHTKGKWTQAKNMIFSDNDLYIGRMVTGKQIPLDEAKANANHIVQMHNSHDGLLEALKGLVNEIIDRHLEGAVIIDRTKDKLEDARKAIAKAEKETT